MSWRPLRKVCQNVFTIAKFWSIMGKGARGLNSRVRCWILIECTILSRLAVIRSFSDEYLSSNRLWHYCLIWCCSCLIWGGGWSTLTRNFLRCSPFCLKAPKKLSEKIWIFFPQKGHHPRQFIFRAPLASIVLISRHPLEYVLNMFTCLHCALWPSNPSKSMIS